MIELSDGEWKLMRLLWDNVPRTIAQMVNALKDETHWKKNTIFVMLSRLEKKGVVRFEHDGRSRLWYPTVYQEDAALYATDRFLSKVYGGSIQLMVAAMTKHQQLNKTEIDELY